MDAARQTDATRQKLMAAALELFAEHGLDGVRIGAITHAAGAANASAIHYHFGGKDGLVSAILDKYDAETSAKHRAYAAELAQVDGVELRDEVRVLVMPYVDLLNRTDGVAYLRLIGQLLGHPRFAVLERHRKFDAIPGGPLAVMSRANEANPQYWQSRRLLVGSLLYHGLADYATLQFAQKRDHRPAERDAFVDELVNAITAVFQGPRA
ncbi:MAG: TetR/AcrR family transcriptional regulator [Myxococcota bacterium]